MKSLLSVVVGSLFLGILLLSGCELVTQTKVDRYSPDGPDLVINEVFTLSPDKYYAFTWIELFNATKKPIPWFSASFPAEGAAVGSGGAAVSTTRDGESWDLFHPGASTEEFHSITFPYTDTSIVAGFDVDSGIVRKVYKDGVGGWSSQNLTSPGAKSVNDIGFPLSSRVGYCITDGGNVYRSTNFGGIWTLQPKPVANFSKNLHSMAFVDFSHIWVCGDSGTIVRRINVSSWVLQSVPSTYANTNLYGIFFSDDTGWAVGDDGAVLQTRNGGTNWVPQTSGVSTRLRSGFSGYNTQTAAYFKQGRAWLCGDNGVILRTDNNGTNWRQVNSQTTSQLNKIVFVDSLKGWAFGNNGTIVATTDGGDRWHVQTSGAGENLIGASFIFPSTTVVLNYYEITMLAQKKHYFVDPVTGVINPDFIVSTDTGNVHFIIGGNSNVPVQGFTIINNDSSKFKDHFKLGPGSTNIINYSFGFDTVIFRRYEPFPGLVSYIEPLNPLLWNLLSSGELRLEKKHGRLSAATGEVLSLDTDVLDVLRYGNYRPSPDPYPNNVPLGFLPEGWSIARFANDFGGIPVDQQSSTGSFYMTKDPIPGWFSQESK